MRIVYKLLSYFMLATCLLTSCSSPRETLHLDISLRNDTSIPLNWVEIKWDGPYIPGGILSPGVSSTSVGVVPPKSDVAKITFVEDVSRKPHSVDLDVSRLKTLHSGKYDAVLSITSLDTAKLILNHEP